MPPKSRFYQRILLLLIILAATFTTIFYSFIILPYEQKMVVGESLNLPQNIFSKHIRNVNIYMEDSNLTKVDSYKSPKTKKVYQYNDDAPIITETGQFNLSLRLFGLIPLKNLVVNVLPEVWVIPGGHSVGVMLPTDGVVVVGHSPVYLDNGEIASPAQDAGLLLGDHILEINQIKIKSEKHAAELVHKLGAKGEIKALIKQNNEEKTINLKPMFCTDTKTFRIGVYIRDNSAGIGTITFYEPKKKLYGALGHMIMDLAKINHPEKGRIVNADIQGIKQGKKGDPGEKIGLFHKKELDGNIEINSNFGIFGRLNQPLINPYYKEGMPVALAQQIHEGEAEIITVISGEKLEKFKINILRVLPQQQPTGKGLIIEIIDPKLLKNTGGIIQGMSGSPIIQNNKLVGAVTHVFVNDPTKGYGCLVEWMLLESEIIEKKYL